MALKITDPDDKSSRTEALGGAVIVFVRGSAHIKGWRLRASVAAACHRRGYRVEFDRHRKPRPATAPPPPAAPDATELEQRPDELVDANDDGTEPVDGDAP